MTLELDIQPQLITRNLHKLTGPDRQVLISLSEELARLEANRQVWEVHDYSQASDEPDGLAVEASSRTTQSLILAGTRKRTGEQLYRLLRSFGVQHVVELGTSLGVGAMYLAAACEQNSGPGYHWSYTGLEGCPQLADEARDRLQALFARTGTKIVRQGTFRTELATLFDEAPEPQAVFLDLGYRYHPDIVEQLAKRSIWSMSSGGLLLLGGVQHGERSRRAWQRLQTLSRVRGATHLTGGSVIGVALVRSV